MTNAKKYIRSHRHVGWVAVILLVGGCNFEASKGGGEKAVTSKRGFAWIRENVLKKTCLRCHQGPASPGGDLSSLEAMLGTGVLVPGNPNASSLFVEIDTGRMPQGGEKLSPAELRAVYDWILEGAKPN